MDVIKPLIEGNKVAVFSKTYCPYCTKAKSALEGVGLAKGSYALLELDNHPRADEIQDALLQLTGGRSVPRVFVNGQFIGGGDDTAAKARDGSLVKLLTACGAL